MMLNVAVPLALVLSAERLHNLGQVNLVFQPVPVAISLEK